MEDGHQPNHWGVIYPLSGFPNKGGIYHPQYKEWIDPSTYSNIVPVTATVSRFCHGLLDAQLCSRDDRKDHEETFDGSGSISCRSISLNTESSRHGNKRLARLKLKSMVGSRCFEVKVGLCFKVFRFSSDDPIAIELTSNQKNTTTNIKDQSTMN